MKLLQPSFGGGEYAPNLHGRVDLARFGISGRTMRNFIVRPTGGMESRTGTQYCDTAKGGPFRLLPFVVSETLAYVVELGHLYARFYFRGALLKVDGVPVEVVTPWSEEELFDVRFTQSADTMFLFHGSHPVRLLRRTGADAFALSTFIAREGPFRNVNGNEALVMSASAATGNVQLTTNFDIFTASLVGALVSIEPQSLGNVKPWAQGERSPNLATGVLRSSDGKIYRATNVPTPPSGGYTEAGNMRPTHESGREWDGPGDTRTISGGVSWIVGAEWEYLHSGYGLVEITSVIDARTANATVKKNLPPEVVGGMGTPGNTWTLSGDGSTKTFAIAGANAMSNANYTVEIGGAPVQSNPNYQPPSSGGGDGGVQDDTGSGYWEDLP